jgi:N-acetylglutamate synthase-like GNAT family acetyltransferase
MYSQKNTEEFYKAIGKIDGYSYSETAHFEAVKSHVSKWPSAILNLEGITKELEQILDQIEGPDKGVTSLPNMIKCCPTKDHTSLLQIAKQRNYRTGSWAAMTHSLSTLKPNDSALTIQEVTSEQDIELWTKIVATELLDDPEMDSKLFKALVNMEGFYFFLGFLQNKAVACSILFMHENVGGVYLVATDKDFRKRGFGSDITNVCLQKAKELGSERVHIQATDIGKNMYASLGFEEMGAVQVVMVTNP